MPVVFTSCINLIKFTRLNAFCQSMKQTHNCSYMSIVRVSIIPCIPNAFVHLSLLNPNWYSTSTSTIFCPILLLFVFAINFVACVLGLIVRGSVHFVALGSYFKAIIVTSVKCVVHCPVSCMMLISCGIGLRIPSPISLSTYHAHHQPCDLLTPHFLHTFFYFTVPEVRGFLICTYYVFEFEF